MFSQKDFIDASRNYVCVRLESYESKEHQDMVRSFLGGRFENTAFCLLAPDGETRLSGTGRGPGQALSERRGPFGGSADDASVVAQMNDISRRFTQKGNPADQTLQDFHSFRQALNVASGDQRLLLFVLSSDQERPQVEATLKPVMSDEEIAGRFHVDFADKETDSEWADAVKNGASGASYVIIRADQFGQTGEAMAQLPLSTGSATLKAAMLSANQAFAANEERKVYSDHVSLGRREGVFFENGMPYGEDRDGDGVIDHGGAAGGKGKGKGR